MAIVLESSAYTTNGTAVTTVAATKPTGVIVGDLLVAVLVGVEAGGGANQTFSSSGWTAYSSQDLNQIGVATASTVFYKMADSSDVSASTYTFTGTTTFGAISAVLMRISGARSSGIAALNSEHSSINSTFATTITPAANSLLVFVVSNYRNTDVISTYAIVTSNPTWTEQYDNQMTGTSYNHRFALATAIRPEATATGDSSCTASVSNTIGAIMMAISPSVVTTTSDTLTITDSVTPRGIYKPSISDTVTNTDSITANKQRKWRTPNKNSSSWVNQDKT